MTFSRESLVQEKAQLADHLERLTQLMTEPDFAALPEEEQEVITEQQAAMNMYAHALGIRIAAYSK